MFPLFYLKICLLESKSVYGKIIQKIKLQIIKIIKLNKI